MKKIPSYKPPLDLDAEIYLFLMKFPDGTIEVNIGPHADDWPHGFADPVPGIEWNKKFRTLKRKFKLRDMFSIPVVVPSNFTPLPDEGYASTQAAKYLDKTLKTLEGDDG